ncbi:MAG: hypothetical protein R3C19_20635 [Planctomycetaceae bacterium]
MQPRSRPVFLVTILLLSAYLPCPSAAQRSDLPAANFGLLNADPMAPEFSRGPVRRTAEIAADARLNDVCAIGSSVWAVGERGVMVHSNDQGTSWTTRLFPFECSLHSVCFLTNRIGWVAGSRFDPYSKQLRGVLLTTRDGGDSWSAVDGRSRDRNSSAGVLTGAIPGYDLPGIRYVKYFDLQNAVALTCQSEKRRAALQTDDGGLTWTPLDSDVDQSGWNHAAFLRPGDGLVVGTALSYGAVVANKLISIRRPSSTLRQVRSASLNAEGQGWISGDGGFLQYSNNGGITWQVPPAPLPQPISEVMDFATTAQQGSTLCVAGSPGSLIVRTNDNGNSWQFSKTNQASPIRRMTFAGPSVVIAVGEFGSILKSTDSGVTWTGVRSSGFRSAVLSLVTEPSDTALTMLAAVSGNDGFRSVVIQPSVEKLGASDEPAIGERFAAAVSQVGGNAAERDWMLARTAPQLHTVKKQLLESWNRQTDGRLGELLPLRLARSIRTWRPDVITVERRAEDDRVAEIWLDAIDVARRIAAGMDHRGAPLDAVGLEPWQTSRVLLRTVDADRSALTYSSDDLLVHLATTPGLVADFSQQELSNLHTDGTSADGYFEDAVSYRVYESTQAAATPNRMFSGLSQQPASDFRRAVNSAGRGNIAPLEETLQKHRVSQSALTGHVHYLKSDVSLTADVRGVGLGLPPALALKQLQHLVQLHSQHENLEGLIAVLQEITRRFPESSEAIDAAAMLFTIYSSSEIRLLRNRTNARSGALQVVGATSDIRGPEPESEEFVQQPVVRPAVAQSLANSQGSDRDAVSARWDAQASTALAFVRDSGSSSGVSALMLLREAANLNRRRLFGEHNAVLSQAAQQEGPFAAFARAELQAVHGAAQTPIPAVNLPEAFEKPFLDGVLNDACWQDATEIRLHSVGDSAGQTDPDCLLMMSWDREFLYVGARMERVTPLAGDGTRLPDREHDADHGTLDRVEFAVDTDRDYATAFRFSVDESGQTSERCWISGRWNPDWYVAMSSDESVWRFEAAIPVAELSEEPVVPGILWAVEVNRVVPGLLRQALVVDADSAGSPAVSVSGTEGFGLIRCIRNLR